jgi:cell shape-determining protein MreD
MKLSEKYYRNSRASALHATLALMLTAASACWIPSALIDNHQGANPLWLFGLIATAIGSAIWAAVAARESGRFYKIGLEQSVYEARRAIRPRL